MKCLHANLENSLNFAAPIPKRIGTTTMHFPEVSGDISQVYIPKRRTLIQVLPPLKFF